MTSSPSGSLLSIAHLWDALCWHMFRQVNVCAVGDRSVCPTRAIIPSAQQHDPCLRVHHSTLPFGQLGGVRKAGSAGVVPCGYVKSRRNGGSAFRGHTLQQHRLLSVPVADCVDSYLSAAAEGIAQLPALPEELYILAGQFATRDEREYKYGLDITLSLAPRCNWDERYGTNCSSGD